jgi:hypothetical protein
MLLFKHKKRYMDGGGMVCVLHLLAEFHSVGFRLKLHVSLNWVLKLLKFLWKLRDLGFPETIEATCTTPKLDT